MINDQDAFHLNFLLGFTDKSRLKNKFLGTYPPPRYAITKNNMLLAHNYIYEKLLLLTM